jgi:nucleotide-binding universal stress UspA family protein
VIRKIVVPLDQSALAEQALGVAVALAHATGASVELLLVHESFAVEGFEESQRPGPRVNRETSYLEKTASDLKSRQSLNASPTLLSGDPAEMICQHAKAIGADIIVMTSHGRTGFSRAWLGSVADRVVREARIPVLLVRPTDGHRGGQTNALFNHVLVLLDASPVSETIIDDAVAIARAGRGRVTLLHVTQPVPIVMPLHGAPVVDAPIVPDVAATDQVVSVERSRLDALANRIKTDVDVDITVVVNPFVARTILDIARQSGADLIALTTRGRGPSRLIIGSIADKILRGCDLPVLIKRPLESGHEDRSPSPG